MSSWISTRPSYSSLLDGRIGPATDELIVDLSTLAFTMPSLDPGFALTAQLVAFGGREALRLFVTGVAIAASEPATLVLLLMAMAAGLVRRRERRG